MISIVVLSILVVMSLIGNTLVILTVLINKPMRTTLNYLLVNLAVADIVFALSTGITHVMMPHLAHPEGHTDRFLCAFFAGGGVGWIGGTVSSLCLVYIAVERSFAIIHPLRQRGRFTQRRLKLFVVISWIVAILICIPVSFLTCYHPDSQFYKTGGISFITNKVNSVVWMVVAGIVPVSIMVYLYSGVVHHLWFKSVQNLAASQRATLRYRKRVTVTLITVSVIYAVCWIANLTAYLMEHWSELIPWFDKTGTVLLTFNCCVNPVLYSMRMKSFREHLRDVLFCKKRGRARGKAALPHVGPPEEQPINRSAGSRTRKL
ncbi:allatostatin-A receptor-like [Orbicella faveolata]|uniref:allatostatin-A receptor-like n=1 Tax=Orbicella faveolata TaxID=48498 RepID=UPI0009E61022|nr:allatostatin-A receptor-like [Orbicella faveolata]